MNFPVDLLDVKCNLQLPCFSMLVLLLLGKETDEDGVRNPGSSRSCLNFLELGALSKPRRTEMIAFRVSKRVLKLHFI